MTNLVIREKWDYLNCPEHKTKQDRYGAGIIAAAAVNFTYTDSDKGSLENIDFMTWEDWTQPVFGEGRKVGDFDMGDVGFGIYGVKNPIFDAISDSNVGLKVVQEVKDFQDSFNVSGKGSLANAYRYKFMLENGTDGKNLVYSRALQPVTFTRFNETTGEGRFEPSYTWVTVYRFSDDSEVADEECCMVIRKTASLPDGRAPKVEDLNNPDLVYRLDYAMTEAYAEQRLPQVWDGKWKFDDGEKLFFEYSRGENNDNTPLPLERMTSIYHDVTETLNPENEYVDSKRFWMVFAFRDGIRVPTDEDGVASPRAQIVIEPRGTVDHIDLQDEEVKHMKSYDSLMPIDNRTYFTISYNPRANLFGKEHISALFIVNNEGARFCKIIYKEDTDTWETMAESTDHPDNQDRLYEIVDVIDESETMRHILLATNLAVDKNFGVMVETERDVYPGALSVIKYNTFGTYPVECRMPALRFDDLKLGALGRRPENDDPSAPFVFNSDTRWSVQGLDDASEVIFSQWRNYNSPAHSWETIGDPDEVYANILYNNQALTGTIPGDKYQAWLNESFNDSSNNLIYNGDCSWSNHDVLAQIYDGASDVVALYLIRAYIPYVPAVLSLKETQTKRKAEVTEGKQVPGYVVLQAMKNASANQSDPSTGVETVTTDPATPAEYYNLQGQRVANPVAGEIYIIRRAGEVSKMIMH